MKKIIDGKRYDTETATQIGFWEFGTSNDHKHVYEALYKTPRNRFFLEYAGGAMSKYAIDQGPNLVGGSSGIRVLTSEEALEWCEQHELDPEEIEKHFPIEDA